MRKTATADLVTKPLSESQAAEAMWAFYRDNEATLITGIRECRDFILAELVKSVPAAQVFAQFVAVPAPATPVRRNR